MNRNFNSLLVVFLTAIALMFFNGCEDSAVDPGDDNFGQLQLSPEAVGASQLGWQTVSALNTHDQFNELVSGKESIITEEKGMINSRADIRKESRVMKRVYNYAAKSGKLSKISADSLVFFEEWSAGGFAGRRALYYDAETETARFYETIYQFPPQLQLTYDSTEVSAFVGPSLEDSTDDRLLTIQKQSLFSQDYFVEQVVSSVEANHWDANNEVDGAIADNAVQYGSQTELSVLNQHAEINPDGSGAISERLDYRDNTFLERLVTFQPDNTGTFSETWRDGTQVTGSFDLFEPDNHALVTVLIDFVNHPTVDQIAQSAEFSLNPQDSSSNAILTEQILFLNGDLDTSRVEVNRSFNGSNWVEHFLVQTTTEGETEFTVVYFDNYKEYQGDHNAPEGFYVRFNGTEYEGGNGELWLEVYTSEQAYLNGEDPILTAHIIYNGDGSGKGEITENGEQYEVTYNSNGEIEVSDAGGRTASVSAFGN